MEYDQDEQNQEGGFFSRLKESPRTVSVLIVILIVAAAIYAFSDNDPAEVAMEEAPEVMEEVAETTDEVMEEGGAGEEESMEEPAMVAPETVSPEVLAEQMESLPEGERTDEGYVETAQAGDGLTHLARRAATRYLNENEAGYELTNEHRIYVEDYIKDNIGSRGLAIGEQVTVTTELVKEAVASAGNLTPQQLQNLSKYVSALQ